MEFWERVHWFFTAQCNERCRFCFKPNFDASSADYTGNLANTLANNKVKEVIFTGGEPLLSKSLDSCLETLHGNGIDTSIHTNATLLSPDRIRDLSLLVDEIAIPVDSTDRKVQEYLRKNDCLPQVKEVFSQLQGADLRIGVHTVATAANIDNLPQIYGFLSKGRFDYWRIYEFNSNLVGDKFTSVERFREVEKLGGKKATASNDGGVNCLFANFLLMEEQFARHNDKRVQFVGVSDYDRAPYFFMDSNGGAYLATWFSQGRKPVGNLLKEGFRKVRDRAVREYSKGPFFDEGAFIETEQDQPLWVRAAWNGNYFAEELEEINPRCYGRFRHLSKLYFNRLKRQGEAPMDAELLEVL